MAAAAVMRPLHALLAVACCIAGAPAVADEDAGAEVYTKSSDSLDTCPPDGAYHSGEKGAWYLTVENDTLAHTDEAYTNGIRLGYDFAAGDAPAFLRAQAGWLCRQLRYLDFGHGKRSGWSAGFYGGQHLFTPGDINDPEPILDDRPYAAWLYLGERFSLHTAVNDRHTNYHDFNLQLGTVGPRAQGEWVQAHFHDLIGGDIPQGWDKNQLADEWEVFGSYRFTHRATIIKSKEKFLELDGMLGYEVGLGTLQVYAEPSATIRVGRGLRDPPYGNLGPRWPLIAAGTQAAANLGAAAKADDEDLPIRDCSYWRWLPLDECFLYLRLSGRYTAHNVFLDGTNWHDSRSIAREDFYGDWAVGARFRGSLLELDLEYVDRGRELAHLPADADNKDGRHRYGSVNLRCRDGANWACPLFFSILLGLVAAQDGKAD